MRQGGFEDDAIKQSLLGVGWAEDIIDEALTPLATTPIAVVPPPPVVSNAPAKVAEVLPSEVAKQQPVTKVESVEGVQPKPKRKKWLKIGAIFFVLLLILSVIGWFIWPLLTPERVVVAAISNLINNDATKYELTAEIQVSPRIGQSDTVPLANSKFIIEPAADEAKPSQGRIFMKVSEPGSLADNPSGDLGSFELRWLENILYLRLDSTAKEIGMFGLDEFIGKWFSIDLKQTLDDLGATEQYNLDLTDDKTQQLLDAYQKNPFLKIEANLGTQTIANQQAKGYQITYDKEKLANWTAEVETITNQPNPRGAAELKKDISDPAEIGTVKIWIADKTKLPVRLENELTATADKIGYKATVTLESLDQPITIEQPDPVTPLDEMVKQLQGSLSGSADQMTKARSWLFSAYGSKE